MADINLTYKIIVLSLLDKTDVPVSNTMIVEFFLDFEYTDYFNAQMAVSDVVDSKLVDVKETHGSTCYVINDEGRKILELFGDRITSDIEADIKAYYNKNKVVISKEQEIIAGYTPLSKGGYMVDCKIMDNKLSRTIYEVNCVVPTKEQAEAICNNWKAKYEELYFQFLDKLTV